MKIQLEDQTVSITEKELNILVCLSTNYYIGAAKIKNIGHDSYYGTVPNPKSLSRLCNSLERKGLIGKIDLMEEDSIIETTSLGMDVFKQLILDKIIDVPKEYYKKGI